MLQIIIYTGLALVVGIQGGYWLGCLATKWQYEKRTKEFLRDIEREVQSARTNKSRMSGKGLMN